MALLHITALFCAIGLSLAACGGNLKGPKGEFTSPNYPDDYPDNADCTWTIEVEKGLAIKLNFTDFELEGRYFDECADFVKIIDVTTSKEIGTYCDEENPGMVYSSENGLRVQFKSDATFGFRGFKANYEAINKTELPTTTTAAPTTTAPTTTATPCGGLLSGPKGEFTSPNYPNDYPNDISCIWTIEVDQGKLIKLDFVDFELEDQFFADCPDYVKIIDPVTSKEIGIYCGDEKPATTYSSASKLRVEFKTDASITYRGFKANYEAVNETAVPPTTPPSPGCKTEITADSGFVISPNYPEKYPDEADCSYTMRLATGGKIALEFADFQLEHDNACANDYVTIHDGDNVGAKQIGKFCGVPTARLVASGDVIFMKFVSDEADTFRGFNATFKKATCENMGGSCSANCTDGAVDWACGAGLQCCLPKLLPDKCGERPTGLLEGVHIVGGEPAKPNSWPWQVSLQSNTGSHYCGAVLFSDQWVVTAAHCVHDETSVNLVLGEHDRVVESGNELRLKAAKIVIHPEFINSSPWPNDIALLKLDAPLKPSPYYSPVCMPDDLDQPFMPDDTCYISGWGDTKGTGDSSILNELLIKPQTNAACRLMWGANYILDTNICVGNGEKGSCQGDSGGPLVCKKKNGWVVGGVTSWGINGCRRKGYPSVYTRVAKFLDWARRNMV